jgi:hypothetical protein
MTLKLFHGLLFFFRRLERQERRARLPDEKGKTLKPAIEITTELAFETE